MLTEIMCKVLVALAYDGTQIVEMNLIGTLINETDTTYIGDFSENVKKLPIYGEPKNYSRVEVEKKFCEKMDKK